MQFLDYSNDIDKYNLSKAYSLQRAQTDEFTKYWAVYRNVNEDFSQSFTEIQTDLTGVNFCFWIKLSDIRVGGAVMLPNGIGDFFLIPPEKDAKKVLMLVIPLLEHWSNKQKPIGAQAITHHYMEAFQRVGFILVESRFWMIRLTEPLMDHESSEWMLSSLTSTKTPKSLLFSKLPFQGILNSMGKGILQLTWPL